MAYAKTTTPLFDSQVGVGGQSQSVGYKSVKSSNAKHRIVPIEYAVPSSALPAAGDIISLTKLNPGAKVIAALSSIVCEDPGTTLTMHVGDLSNPKRYTASAVLSAASSTVGSGVIGFGMTPGIGKELFVPMNLKQLPLNPTYVAPAAWVTGVTYNIGDRVTQTSLTYVCLIKHVAGVHATDLTALKWVLSGSYQPWVTSTSYTIGDAVIINGLYYICIVAHTSGTFATDLASLDWVASTADETEVIAQCASISTLTAGSKITFMLAVVDE